VITTFYASITYQVKSPLLLKSSKYLAEECFRIHASKDAASDLKFLSSGVEEGVNYISL
jgi:hypothetical protein